jgi:hypothetical protein
MGLKKREYSVLLGENGGKMLPVALRLGCCCRGTGKTKIGQFVHEHSFPYVRSLRVSVCVVYTYVYTAVSLFSNHVVPKATFR